MEGLQHFSPLRTGSWEDVAINALGCLAGVLLFTLLAAAGPRTTPIPRS
jgi:VanZ family protein